MTGDEEDAGRSAEPKRATRWSPRRKARDVAIGFEDGAGRSEVRRHRAPRRTGLAAHVTGTPAHSSQIFSEEFGSGAIYEAARILNAFREQMAGEAHLTFNPGVIARRHRGRLRLDAGTRGTAFGKTNVIADDDDRLRRPAHAVAGAARQGEADDAGRSSARASAADDGDAHVRRRLSAAGADRRQRAAARRCTIAASRDLGFGAGHRGQPRQGRRRRRLVRRAARCR